MAMQFDELDEVTRRHMLEEFEAEEHSGNPFRSAVLSAVGLAAFPDLMRESIRSGNEENLRVSLLNTSYWRATNARGASVNVAQQADQLSLTEFNTWYVRGLCKRLMKEGVDQCQIYRAENAKYTTRAECACTEGRNYPVSDIYAGHRAKYWPIRNPSALSVPAGPSCHHTIRRV